MIEVDSDYLVLELKPSNIPGAGLGVFAKVDIPAGIILCEYRGSIIFRDKIDIAKFNNRCLNLNNELTIVGSNCIASFINDAIDLKKIYTKDEIKKINEDNCFPLLKEYNCCFQNTLYKSFIVSIKDIKEGEELFCSYGIKYWLNAIEIVD